MFNRQVLYQRLAAEISQQISRGMLKPGDRLPSVRRMSEQKNVSLTTVLQAYQLLEDQGLIAARPQSGYYIQLRSLPDEATPQPVISELPPDPEQVRIEHLFLQMLRDVNNPNLFQFGTAVPAPDLLPSEKINRILARIARSGAIPHQIYGTPEGSVELRSAVAHRCYLNGCPLSADDLVITAGCVEAIGIALRVVCRPGDLVAIESPTYFGILHALESQGLRALEIPTHHRDGISLDALQFALEHHPIRAVVVISNFNNPLGSLMSSDNKKALVDLLARHDIPLIEDDINGELSFSNTRPDVAKHYDQKGLVMLCSSFSKDISSGLRVGWIAPGRFRDAFIKQKTATNVGTAVLPQLAVAEFIENGGYDHHLRSIRRAYAQKVDHVCRTVLRAFPTGTRVTSPQGGHVVWVQMPENIDSLSLYRQAIKAGISIAPGYMFSPTPRYHNYLRLNAAYMSFSGERAIERLGEIAGEIQAES